MSPTSSLIPRSSHRPGDDPIFALHAEAVRRVQGGEEILNATIGALIEANGDLALMPAVSEAFQRIPAEKSSTYAPISGSPRFLDAVIADLYGEEPLAGHSVAVATPGGTGAVHHAVVNFLEPGQELLTTSYRWGPYDIIAEHTGRGVRTFPMYRADGRLDLDAFEEQLAALLLEQGRALVICNTPCHNPTGYSLDGEEWERTVAAVGRAAESGPVAFLLDLAYAKFAPPGAVRWQDFAARMAEKASVLVAWSASKAYAQYGSRVGALVASHPDPEERDRIRNALGYSCRGTWSNCNHLGMLAVTELLTDPELRGRCDAERERLRQLLGKRVTVFNELARSAGLRYPRYEGGFFVSVFTPDAELTAAQMREAGVYVVPLDGAVRVALCSTPASNVPRLVEALAAGVRAAEG